MEVQLVDALKVSGDACSRNCYVASSRYCRRSHADSPCKGYGTESKISICFFLTQLYWKTYVKPITVPARFRSCNGGDAALQTFR